MSKYSSFFNKLLSFAKTKTGIVLIIVLVVGGYFTFRTKTPKYTFVSVRSGTITETVSVTGNTTPTQSANLAFQNSGTVSGVYAKTGDVVYAGQLLASLNTADLSAQLRQAKANVDAQNAKLASLKNGSRPEDIASYEATYNKSQQDLQNMYGSIGDILNDSYSKANDAVRTQINALFSNDESINVQLTFNTSSSQTNSDVKSQRINASSVLNDWQTQVFSISPTTSPADFEKNISSGISNLSAIRVLLNNVSLALDGATNLDNTTLATYKGYTTAALTEVNTAIKNLNTISQSISSQKLTVVQAKAQFDLKKAGTLQSDIDAQVAQVEQAEANVASIEAKISNSKIFSPIDGTVTQFDAKNGQIASSGLTLVSVISNSSFEIDAQVPETDLGKIAIGNPVKMRFDAFPGETFDGNLFYIDPAQTVNQGVIDYKIKVSFKNTDPRIKSGLTANMDIQTKQKDNAMILPQYAVLQNDNGTFVRKIVGGVATDTPVTLGISDQNGNVEIVVGVVAGEQVLNIGLKQ
jgi:HlyD family secretion protein